MKVIETRYKGCRFRSRTEARWAVYFDAVGVKWEYEPEGFEFEDGHPFRETDGGMSFAAGGRYLPDFRILRKGVVVWAEVKGAEFTPGERELCELLVINTHQPCLLLAGIPEPVPYPVLLPRAGWLAVKEATFVPQRDATRAARSARFEHGEAPR